MRILDWLIRKNKESKTKVSPIEIETKTETKTEEIEVKKKLLGKKEEYIEGRKLTGAFLTDVQLLAMDYTLDDLKRYLRITREKYEEKKEYGELFTKILFATILKVGAIKIEDIEDAYGHKQKRVILNDDLITRIAEELYTDKKTARKMAYVVRDKLYEWIIKLYLFSDYYPGYGYSWSIFTNLVDYFSSLRKKMEEETQRKL
jgi:KaiC/GvpD/RAD55 family RecA-like ATPase